MRESDASEDEEGVGMNHPCDFIPDNVTVDYFVNELLSLNVQPSKDSDSTGDRC